MAIKINIIPTAEDLAGKSHWWGFTEGYENENEGMMSLLQFDEEERWGLRFFDCGTVNFMVPANRREDDFSNVSFFLHSS